MTTFTTGERQVREEPRHALVEDRTVIATCLVPERAGQPAVADAGRPGDDEIVVRRDPVTRDQLHEQRAVEPTRAAIVNILGCRLVAQFGDAQAGGELTVVPETLFAVE